MLLRFNEPSELRELKVTDPPGCAKYDGFRSTIPPPELFELELEFVHCILIPRTNNELISCICESDSRGRVLEEELCITPF